MKLADLLKAAKYSKYANVEHAKKFAKHVVPEVIKPARIIWNQAIGGVFLLFAVLFFSYAYHYSKTDSNNPVGLGFSVFLGAIMSFFGVSSFLRARRIGRTAVRR